MILQPLKQYLLADIIVGAVCEVGEISYTDFINHPATLELSVMRGVACLLSWEYGIHPNRMKWFVRRTRCNVINQSKRYRFYVQANDPLTMRYYSRAKEIISKKINHK